MTHIRTTIRNIVKAAIVAADTGNVFGAGTPEDPVRIYETEIEAKIDNKIPCANITILDDEPGPLISLAGYEQEFTLPLMVEVVAKRKAGDAESIGFKLDELAEIVESAIKFRLDGSIDALQRCTYNRTSFQFDAQGAHVLGFAAIRYDCVYIRTNTPDVDYDSLNDLQNINIQYDMIDLYHSAASSGPDGQIDAEDDIENLHV